MSGKVVIIGGGFGGLQAARSLKRSGKEILLIDKTNHHLFQPLLYQVATAALSPGEIAMPIRSILRRQENVSVLMGDVASIEMDRRELRLSDGSVVPYDFLVVAVGSRPSYFGHEEWERYAPGLKTLHDALNIRNGILLAFERAEASSGREEVERLLSFVIIGGGPTGVEISGAVAETARKTMMRNFRRIEPRKTRVYLVEGGERILPEFSVKLAGRARRDLEALGVEVLTGRTVTHVDENGVRAGDIIIKAGNVIWAAGNTASPLLKTLGVPLDGTGRVLVGPDLSIPGHSEVFVIGDAACSYDKDGRPLPATAPAAIQEARYVADIIRKDIGKNDRKPFEFFDKGMLATVGKNRAIAHIGRFEFGGPVAWAFWSAVHLMYIVVFANRLLVFMRWVYSYLTGQRGVRIISPSRPGNNHRDTESTEG
jgi:NADH dehydrogenase